MNDLEAAQIAAKVSLLLQLDRLRHNVDTEVDMKALGNVPQYIASVFEQSNAIAGDLSPAAAYELVNKRVSRLEAQLYLMRLELDNRFERDPARLFEDPLAISTYGERMETIIKTERRFSFESSVLAYGWYPIERSGEQSFRWMRTSDVSVACIPHLGAVDQIVEIYGSVLAPAQLEGLRINAVSVQAQIRQGDEGPARFVARLDLQRKDVKSANFLPIEFTMTDFRQPSEQDTRLLGASVDLFVCRPAVAGAPMGADPAAPQETKR